MKKIRTFVDSNVLIAAATGKGKHALHALTILSDPTREFASSPFVRLEVLPKAIYHQQALEAAFYERFFAAVEMMYEAAEAESLLVQAEQVGGRFGLNMADALHIAAALALQAEEFVTAERPTSPFKNVIGIKITTIYTP